MTDPAPRTPRWVWGLILALAAIQPVVHLLALYAAPDDTVPTGLDIPDSALFRYSMDMIPSGLHSHYATCQSELGDASIRFYSVPHLWLYGLLGLVTRVLPGDPFLYYGLANGLGALLYLWVVYRLLVLVSPAHAGPAFLLFALSGGPGGLLYLAAALAGLHGHPAFDAYFFRFGVYDLMEGPHFNPVLYFPRLYYTLSLAGCLGGLGAVLQDLERSETRVAWGWTVAVLAGSFLDARFAAFTFGLLLLYLFCHGAYDTRRKKRALLAYGLPGGAGFLLAGALMRLNPAVIGNHQSAGAMAMWFSPFVVVTWLHWIGAGPIIAGGSRRATGSVRLLLGAGLGYLAAYAAGYFLYQMYYGNLLAGRDGSVAAAISDWALPGALAGAVWAWWKAPVSDSASETPVDPAVSWLLLWLVGYTALSLSGFGGGWFLRFGPQRLQVFLWLPLCALAAMGLAAWTRPWRRAAYSVLVGCGVCSMGVAAFAFQSPLGRTGAAGPYPELHAEIMHEADARMMDSLGDGMLLAPAPAGDIIVRRRGNPVVFGIGSFNLTDRPYAEPRAAADVFFDLETPDATRRAIARNWCVDWVYCPATWPVAAATREHLKAEPWLEVVAEEGDGMVLRVLRD